MTLVIQQSKQLFDHAKRRIPGGVNSPVRAFRGVGGDPLFIESAEGAYLQDADGNRYVDYVGSWGPMIVGHAHPEVIQVVSEQLKKGLSFGAPTEIETRLADLVGELVPSMEMMRFVSSGTEAAMSAIRVARGFTGRDKIVKFAGCYHGHADSLLVSAGSGALTLGVPSSQGVPASVAEHTLVVEYNDLVALKALFEKYPKEIACVILEPVAGNMNCVLPDPQFLQGMRELCDQYGSVLIWDEVMTGFRVALGGAQARYGIKPDLTVLGKVIGGGMPVGAFGGRHDIMSCVAPLGKVYQAGTLSGNPIAMAAGLKTLSLIQAPGFYDKLEQQATRLMDGLIMRAKAAGIPFTGYAVGGMFGIFFNPPSVIRNESDVKQCNINQFQQFFHGMLAQGVYLAPSAYEAGFISSAHGEAELQLTFQAAEKVFQSLTN